LSLPNPDAHILFLAFSVAAGNNLKGNFYQFGIKDGYVMAAAYGCSVSPTVAALRLREGGEPEPMEFWGFNEAVAPEVQAKMMSTGLPPESLRLVTKATGPADADTHASVVYISQDSAVAVLAALMTVSPLLQSGTVLILDRWWSLDSNTRRGFDEWASTVAPLKDFDSHFEIFHDNGWARAFFIR
jgi:hypothetical protein